MVNFSTFERVVPLGRGVRAHLLPLPRGRFSSGELTLVFLSQLGDGRGAEAALLPQVLSLGSRQYPSLGRLNRALDMLYDPSVSCRVTRRGEVRLTAFTLSFLEGGSLPPDIPRGRFFDKNTEGALDLFLSLLLDPPVRIVMGERLLRADFLERERGNLLAALRAERNEKAAYARRRCTELLCAGEPYARGDLSDEASLRAATLASLTEYYHSLLEEQPLEIFYAGSEDLDIVLSYLREKLSPLLGKNRAERPLPVFWRRGEREGELRFVEEYDEMLQGRLCVGCRIDGNVAGESLPAFLLFREILSGAPMSKFFRHVREEQGLCYDCYAAGDMLGCVLFFCAGVSPEMGRRATGAMLAQLDALRAGEVTAEELSSALHSLAASLREMADNPSSLLQFSLREHLLPGKIAARTPQELLAALPTLKIEDVAAIARRIHPQIAYFLRGK